VRSDGPRIGKIGALSRGAPPSPSGNERRAAYPRPELAGREMLIRSCRALRPQDIVRYAFRSPGTKPYAQGNPVRS
jgi:hypothetical protein